MSKYCSLIIDTLNHDRSVSVLLNPVDKIQKRLKEHKEAQEKDELSLFTE
jgi:ribose-phosphate pyrophosphokinase